MSDEMDHTGDALPYLKGGHRTFVLEEGVAWTDIPKPPPGLWDRLAWRAGAKPRVVLNPDVETERADPVLRLVKKP